MWLWSCEFIDLAQKKKTLLLKNVTNEHEVRSENLLLHQSSRKVQVEQVKSRVKRKTGDWNCQGKFELRGCDSPWKDRHGPSIIQHLVCYGPNMSDCFIRSHFVFCRVHRRKERKRRRKSFSIITIIIIRLHLKINCGTCCACSPLKNTDKMLLFNDCLSDPIEFRIHYFDTIVVS